MILSDIGTLGIEGNNDMPQTVTNHGKKRSLCPFLAPLQLTTPGGLGQKVVG